MTQTVGIREHDPQEEPAFFRVVHKELLYS